jgi:hypothetical protein
MTTIAEPTTERREPDTGLRSRATAAIASNAYLPLAGALTALFAFRAGGFFPTITGVAAIAVALLLLLRVTLAAEPFAGWTGAAAAAALPAACFAGWTLVSALWSDAPARAIVEFDRALLYVLVLTLLAMVPRRVTSLTVLLRWVLLALVAVAVAGLASRLGPTVFPTTGRLVTDRLTFPLTYWNATGVAAALGAVLALHHASGEQEPRWVRVGATAAIPALLTTIYFTFSRGAIVAAAIGALLYLALAHPRRLPFAVVAAAPPAVVALVVAYGAEHLATERYFAGAGPDEGRTVALVLAGMTILAAALRFALGPLEERAARLALPKHAGRWAVAAAAVAIVAAGVAFDAPGRADRELDAFRSGNVVPVTGDARDRLTQRGNNGRFDFWEVSVHDFEREPLHGTGAGTYRHGWFRERPNTLVGNDGHSLYLEVLGELGIVGLVLLAVALVVPLGVAVGRLRGPERHAHAAFLAAGGALLIHSGVDWDWEMPALWIWFFAAAGVVLAGRGARAVVPSRVARLAMGIACLLLAVTPALVVSSQPALGDARSAFVRGDCDTAVDRALSSLETLRVWPEAYEILGYCNLRGGATELGLRAMQSAHRRDPDDWQFTYGLAVAQALAGQDPRPMADLAARQNPREELATGLARRLRDAPARRWPRIAARADIPPR